MKQRNVMEQFQRSITYGVTAGEDGRMTLRSLLQDRFHDIEAIIIADIASLEIVDSRVEFRRAPTSDCPKAIERLELLNGFVIGPGLSRKLAEVFGGPTGCGNLRTMLAGLLPLALNLQAAAGLRDDEEAIAAIHEKLLGTCAGYPRPEEDR
ncbi:MAG: hypothetical protein A2X84_06640 [Desulfuromonadaceae bacterium GWC2_58_13]|nr:MAG: hypothetical protein A2X84_06640 [Desulfuromonadaceae bacterium GWC2_58_13]